MSQYLIIIGFVLLFVAIFLIIIGSILSTKETKFAFGGFVGPIPFGFANDPRILWIMIGIMIALIIIFIFPTIKGLI